MMRHRWASLVCASALLVAAGCGGESSEPTASPATTSSDTTPPDTAAIPDTTATPDTTRPDTVPPPSETTPTETTAERALGQVVAPEASAVTELLELERPIVIAHAGGDFEAPHSTMFAFTQAALAGTDVLEMDVMLTADDVLVVHHDDTVDRTTEASGSVRDLTYDELAALDNAHWFVEGTWSDRSRPDSDYVFRGVRTGDRPAPAGYGPDDFRIETFAAVASAFPDHVLDVEIKVQRDESGTPDLARAQRAAQVLADEIVALGRTDSVIVVSFDSTVMEEFAERAPGVATSPALDTLVAWYLGEPTTFTPTDRVFQVPPVYEGVEVLTPEVVQRAQREGFAVWVWMDDTGSQENAPFYEELLARGVDGLLVSRPQVAVAVIEGR
ncbi:MAG TPA: glycerophosphodiester phosphodiesterase family protein [Ilumatobacteraceae bacterium]|nr:glycerophosphodiester phosphodiesterase family protein [Ilumatobacteraceae bacterium]